MIEEIYPKIVFSIGGIPVTNTVTTTWIMMGILISAAYFISSRLKTTPGTVQHIVEYFIVSIDNLIKTMIGKETNRFLPLVATLALMIGTANLMGIIPGMIPPTHDINTPLAFALVVFFSVPYFGIRVLGFKQYSSHYFSPSIVFFPIHLVSEFTRVISLTFRLFGNIIGEEIIIAVLFVLTPLFLPVPMLVFSLFTGILQAFIFTVLTIVYISGAVLAGPAHNQIKED